MSEFQIGDKVTAIYKTGKYIGEITEERPQHYLVRVLAVLTHPMQGDLHHPKSADVGIFHERRSLAYREQTNVPKQMVKHYVEEIPEYQESLRIAVDKLKKDLVEAASPWADKSLEIIKGLEQDYFK
ncbi:kinase-associated lipoprotein B [Bacillus sp. EB600]|uniref:kinase-associated lipoprotein B n=1 Tax=Bacillus sp. EB600 TaxID=2806345 RepID=UPI002108F0D0|nr:kinase-associated lipoprotein B [Bacillus sp. EB600]MCQ6278948.1 kinase-associated lipoprotein B [Bacillus sp. EB600]